MKTPLLLPEAVSKISCFKMVGLSIPVLAALFFSAAAAPARAAGITVSPLNQIVGVPEEGQIAEMSYTISNNNPFAVILDYALVTIKNVGFDHSDYANYPDFDDWFPVIPANDTSTWVLSFHVSDGGPCTPTDCDSGLNPITFSTEWSPLVGSAIIVGAPNVGFLVFIDNDLNLDPSANYVNGVADLNLGLVPDAPIDIGGQQATVSGDLVVYDTPEI